MKFLPVLLLLFAACGDDGNTNPRRDAAVITDGSLIDTKMFDAPTDAQAFVLTVACTSGEPVVTTNSAGTAFEPNTVTILENEVVKFVMIQGSGHSVAPDDTNSDPGLLVTFDATKCLQFTTTGTFGFQCNPHGFKGSVTVN